MPQRTFTPTEFIRLFEKMLAKHSDGDIISLENLSNKLKVIGIDGFDPYQKNTDYDNRYILQSEKDKILHIRQSTLKYSVISDSNVKRFKKEYYNERYENGKLNLPDDLLKINFKPLSTKLAKAIKSIKKNIPDTKIRVQDPLGKICLLYIETENESDLSTEEKSIGLTNKIISPSISEVQFDDFNCNKVYYNYTYFLVSFLSIGEFKIKHGIIGIDLQHGNKNPKREFDAIEFGIHNREDANKRRNRLYKGKARLDDAEGRHYYLHIDLLDSQTNEKSYERRLHISSLFARPKNIRDQNLGKGVAHGVSLFEGFFSMELVLSKISGTDQVSAYDLAQKFRGFNSDKKLDSFVQQELINNQSEQSILSLYLILHRNTFRVSDVVFKDLKGLIAKKINIEQRKYIIGNYRIWHFNTGLQRSDSKNSIGKIVQSIFIILPDGTAYLKPFVPKDIEDSSLKRHMSLQPAHINMSNVSQNLKLWITTFSRKGSGMNILNTAIFDYPQSRQIGINGKPTKTKYITGHFSSIGYSRTGTISNFVLMFKDENVKIKDVHKMDDEDSIIENDFKPMEFYLEENEKLKKANYQDSDKIYTINKYIEKHPRLLPFYDNFKILVASKKEELWWYNKF